LSDVLLTVVVPVYNEERSIEPLLTSVLGIAESLPGELEVVVVDDGSKDCTVSIVATKFSNSVCLIAQMSNQGKGAAVQAGIAIAKGTLILVQDADLEYDARDIPRLVDEAITHDSGAIYASRLWGAKCLGCWRGLVRLRPRQSVLSWGFNFVLIALVWVKNRTLLTDPLTGYKLYPRSLFAEWTPKSSGFETDHEITNEIIHRGIPIREIPIRYSPRPRDEGKKIGVKDALLAIQTILTAE